MLGFPKCFHLPAVLVMLAASAAAAIANNRFRGPWFEQRKGLPFSWSVWVDYGPPFHHFSWWMLAADIFIAAAVVLAVGVMVERFHQRFASRR